MSELLYNASANMNLDWSFMTERCPESIIQLFPKLLFLQLNEEKGSSYGCAQQFQVLLPLAMFICLITIKLATRQMTNGP